MSSASLVSILMPLHNACKTVGATIHSVEAQTYPHFELICVDDASEDGTDSIVKGFAQSDERIRYCRLASNRGVGAARNVALRLARGDYVCFVDGDDAIEPDYIETMLRRMTVDAMDMACCGYDRGQGGEVRSFVADDIWPKERVLLALVSDETFFTSLWNKMFRRKPLIADDGAPLPFCEMFQVGEDEEWLSRVLQRCNGCSVVSKVLYHWNRTEGSLSFHQSLDTDVKALSHISARERTYHNLAFHDEAAARSQARLAASLAQFLAARYVEQGPAVRHRYNGVFRRARMAAEIRGGVSRKRNREFLSCSCSCARRV